MDIRPIAEQNRAFMLAAEKTRQTILTLQAQIAELEDFYARCIELSDAAPTDPETAAIAERFAPMQEAA